jgi:hypothetical protein
MRSCAVLRRRRALHDHGHRAVRRRGDIRHRSSNGACEVGPDAQLGRVSADGVRRPIATGGAALACAQGGSGGVVRMEDGAVTFKGGSISNSTAVRACAQREWRIRARWYGMLRGAARPMDGAHGARCGEWCAVYGAFGRRGACCIGCIIIVASMRVASVLRRALHRCALHVASARVARCMVQTRSRPAAHGRAVRCAVSGARALPDRAKAGLLRLPSGGRMRLCAA